MPQHDDEQKFKVKCEDLLAQVERLDAEIGAAAVDKKSLKKLQREKADLHRQFAVHLRDSGKDRYQNRSWSVWARCRIQGVPSKKAREQARSWMETKNFFGWDGFAPELRYEIGKALQENKSVPDGYFGLHVEWTVEVHGRVQHPDA